MSLTTMTIRVPADAGSMYQHDALANNVGKRIEILRGALDGLRPQERVFGILTAVTVSPNGDSFELTVVY